MPPSRVPRTAAVARRSILGAGGLPKQLRYQTLPKPMGGLFDSLRMLAYRAELQLAAQTAPHLSKPESAHQVVRASLVASEATWCRSPDSATAQAVSAFARSGTVNKTRRGAARRQVADSGGMPAAAGLSSARAAPASPRGRVIEIGRPAARA